MGFGGQLAFYFASLVLMIVMMALLFVRPMNAALDVARDTAVDQAKRLVECKEERDSAILDRQAADEGRNLYESFWESASKHEADTWTELTLLKINWHGRLERLCAQHAKPKGRPPYWFGIEETK
jgi:hypothetical protein